MYIKIDCDGFISFFNEDEVLATNFFPGKKEVVIMFKGDTRTLTVSFDAYDKKEYWDMLPKNTEVALKS